MERVRVHHKTQSMKDEKVPIEERIRKMNGSPHVNVGDAEECRYPEEVRSAFYSRSKNAIEVDQDLIDEIINREHMCDCQECDIPRIIKFLTKRKGEEVFITVVR